MRAAAAGIQPVMENHSMKNATAKKPAKGKKGKKTMAAAAGGTTAKGATAAKGKKKGTGKEGLLMKRSPPVQVAGGLNRG